MWMEEGTVKGDGERGAYEDPGTRVCTRGVHEDCFWLKNRQMWDGRESYTISQIWNLEITS